MVGGVGHFAARSRWIRSDAPTIAIVPMKVIVSGEPILETIRLSPCMQAIKKAGIVRMTPKQMIPIDPFDSDTQVFIKLRVMPINGKAR